jgi:hypothetical protein
MPEFRHDEKLREEFNRRVNPAMANTQQGPLA